VGTTIVFAGLLCVAMPVAFVLAVAGTFYMITTGGPYQTMIIQTMISTVDSFVFLCVPFFLLTGDIMSEARITDKLILLCTYLVGGIRASLAYVTVITSMIFAGISGSAAADASALGAVLIPGMKDDGYKIDDACALVAMASVIGPIIPPSIPMVILGLVTGISIGKLFLSGAIPGILLGACLMTIVYLKRKDFPPARVGRPKFLVIMKVFIETLPALVTPLIIVGGIVLGVFSPTEASAIGVVWSLICGLLIYRTLKLSDLPKIFLRTSLMTGAVLILLAASGILGWGLAMERIPDQIGELLLSISANKYMLLVYIIILVLFLGTFMDPSVIIIIMAPILMPIVVRAGIDPIHFGLAFVLPCMIGLVTPPLGVCLFIASSIGKISVERICRAIWPYLIISVVLCFAVAFIPALSTWLPNLLIR
jgi:C4-dicarboxylate transporter, DctM subunit